jgi:hypothetical protein
MSSERITSDGQGVLVGVDPANPQPANSFQQQQQRPDQAVSQQQPAAPQQQTPPGPQPRWSDEDIERARQQEKDKLYPRLEEMNAQLKAIQEERQTELAERQRLAEEAEAARRAKEESEMEVRQLLEKREQEWNQRFEQQQARYEHDRAIFEQEQRRVEVANYRRDRIEQEQEFILPELREFVGGDTPEEIDASIEAMKMRSESIINNVAAASQPQFRGTVMPSVPPVGPMEQLPTDQTLTPEDIKGMDMKTYERYRDQLLRATSPNQRRG